MSKLFSLIFFSLTFPVLSLGQDSPVFNKISPKIESTDQGDYLSKEFHQSRRQELRKLLPDSGMAVFFSAPVRNRSNDVDYQYHQQPDFYYMTGITEPDAVLLVFKRPVEINGKVTSELIFVPQKIKSKEIWMGKTLGVESAMADKGIQMAHHNTVFADTKLPFAELDSILYMKVPEDIADKKEERGDLFSLISYFKKGLEQSKKVADARSLGEHMARLRQVKTQEEILLMKKAVDMSCKGHIELMKALKPGMSEYQAQAIMEYMFKNNGSEYPGYPSILGGGENSCVLHYSTNRKQLNGQDMLVADAGAEYHGYTADITRTLPTDGKFSEQEKAIYQIVLDAEKAGIEACLEGKNFWDPHQAAIKVIQKGLLELGIIKESKDYINYFMHGTSHYLGLDVHDAGLYGRLQRGNIITVEPGIYIAEGSDCDEKWWNIGIRIEDDILITEGAPINMSESVPREIAEIEKLMAEESIFNKIK